MTEPVSSESAEAAPRPPAPPGPPPKWKFAIVVLLAIYPLLLIVLPLMGRLFDSPYLGVNVPIGPEFFVRTFATAVILVTLMVWVALPLLTRLFRPWLQAG
jgi:antibiotic biosynthesis monooxygenase (ABM) superfamily enzyme